MPHNTDHSVKRAISPFGEFAKTRRHRLITVVFACVTLGSSSYSNPASPGGQCGAQLTRAFGSPPFTSPVPIGLSSTVAVSFTAPVQQGAQSSDQPSRGR